MNDVVYVVSWRRTEEMSSASMDALLWTLGNNLNDESTFPSYSSLPIQRCKANGNRIRRKREQWSRDQNIERKLDDFSLDYCSRYSSSFISSPDILLDCLERYMYVDKVYLSILAESKLYFFFINST
uniref:Uncharacterized protein n=1 Tax=Lactuca sativa TaxID=4236 RepID=A0A9R1W646_LACSA|nr:hypothetical protein LSAT_V11C300102690 [Lactuca sativa]